MYCSHCGNRSASEANFCSHCGAALPPVAEFAQPSRIVRPRHPRMIAGVCSGFALRYGWDVNVTRVLFCLLTLLTAFWLGVISYIVAWVVLPDAQYNLPAKTYPSAS